METGRGITLSPCLSGTGERVWAGRWNWAGHPLAVLVQSPALTSPGPAAPQPGVPAPRACSEQRVRELGYVL